MNCTVLIHKWNIIYGNKKDIIFKNTGVAVFESKTDLRFVFSKNISAIAEISFFRSDVEIERGGKVNNIQYNIEALFLGIDVGF